ncbi:hypothetical protein QJQ45_016224 [Haematococcus lacustris]|nr:hypothetical protein QJQ45_016224 [Haematococcus lacustris]
MSQSSNSGDEEGGPRPPGGPGSWGAADPPTPSQAQAKRQRRQMVGLEGSEPQGMEQVWAAQGFHMEAGAHGPAMGARRGSAWEGWAAEGVGGGGSGVGGSHGEDTGGSAVRWGEGGGTGGQVRAIAANKQQQLGGVVEGQGGGRGVREGARAPVLPGSLNVSSEGGSSSEEAGNGPAGGPAGGPQPQPEAQAWEEATGEARALTPAELTAAVRKAKRALGNLQRDRKNFVPFGFDTKGPAANTKHIMPLESRRQVRRPVTYAEEQEAAAKALRRAERRRHHEDAELQAALRASALEAHEGPGQRQQQQQQRQQQGRQGQGGAAGTAAP